MCFQESLESNLQNNKTLSLWPDVWDFQRYQLRGYRPSTYLMTFFGEFKNNSLRKFKIFFNEALCIFVCHCICLFFSTAVKFVKKFLSLPMG